jgi:hypothetical protein
MTADFDETLISLIGLMALIKLMNVGRRRCVLCGFLAFVAVKIETICG